MLTIGISYGKIQVIVFPPFSLSSYASRFLKIEYPLILGLFPYKAKYIDDISTFSMSNIIFDVYIKANRGKWWANSELKFYYRINHGLTKSGQYMKEMTLPISLLENSITLVEY